MTSARMMIYVLDIVLIWLMVDVLAIVVILCDYKHWYGQSEIPVDEPADTSETSPDSIPPFAA